MRETATDPFGKPVMVERYRLTNVASRIWHSNPNIGAFLRSPTILRSHEIDKQMIERLAPRVLDKYKTLLGIDPQQFTLKRTEWDGEFWYVSFEQFYKGIPVHTGKFGFTLNRDGIIISIGSDGYPGLDLSVTPQRNSAEVVEIARSRFNAENPDSLMLLSEPVLLIYPNWLEEEVKYHLAYKIELHDQISGDKRRYFVDANTGDILYDGSMWKFGNWTVSGNVKGTYWPVNSGGAQDEAPARQSTVVKIYNTLGQQVTSSVTDTNGDYSISGNHAYQTFFVEVQLKGNWSRIKNPNNQVSATQSFVTSGSYVRNFNFSDPYDGFHVYHHMNIIHDFIKGSPFNYNGMDWQMEARIRYNDVPNAAADGTALYFSENNRNWWESSDVVYHEYTHNIIHSIYGDDIGSTGGAMGDAMDEGIADYFAATINEEPTIDWVGRTVSNNLTMDNYNDQGNDPWFRGQILSGAMWDLESTTSLNTARRLNFKAMRITPRPDTYVEFVDNVILADDNNGKLCDGTPNYDAILQAFQTNHGIIPSLSVPPLCPPTNLTITNAGNIGQNPILNWNTSSGATYYKIYRTVTPVNWQVIGTTTSTSYTDWEVIIEDQNNADDEFYYEVTAVNDNGDSDPSNIVSTWGTTFQKQNVSEKNEEKSYILPEDDALHQNYPNPFNPTTTIRYELPEYSHVVITIYNLQSQIVAILVDTYQDAGYHFIKWNAFDQPSGIYICRMETPKFTTIKKMTILK